LLQRCNVPPLLAILARFMAGHGWRLQGEGFQLGLGHACDKEAQDLRVSGTSRFLPRGGRAR
jgi:hypothetical protein